MNSYPNEFLSHPQPLMFVAGLLPPSNTRERSGSVLSTGGTRRSSIGGSSLLEPSTHGQGTTPLTSPSLAVEDLPSSPPVDAGPSSSSQMLETIVDDVDREFEDLVTNLRGALGGKGGKGKVWLGEGERRDFRIVLVDKLVRLPMRKVNPSTGSSASSSSLADPPSTPHSPLSPLTSSSPLYPDGLIAPVWVRKHAELVPSVFVLFLRLYESKPPASTAEGGRTPEVAQKRQAEEKIKEKEMDDKLIGEVGERRRRLGERGIKLTIVLMASSAALDSPSLDTRLSYLRRASSLSAKASLFVLTPVPADQLPDFVNSLQEALYDSALEYYTAHAKRVRRKRSRVPTSLPLSVTGTKILVPQGWAVRYDWKAGWFAEVRGDLDAARRHYEDCWNELARMFASTTTLPPRTKRWAEAKVLADCVAVRICKLILYENESVRVLGPFYVHLKRFSDLSRGWGIGEDTFEFWSWIARQYRIFAELLELGQQAGLRISTTTLPVFPEAGSAVAPPPNYYITPISSLDPKQILQQPAYYYYTAAICSIERRKRFEVALEAERDALGSEAGSASGYVSSAPGFANEKKVDHSALIIELFSKAYSLLKEQEYAQNRVALYVAYRIAETYTQSEQYDMAMRFFDRISPSFKREKWTPIVRKIRKSWYECAQRTGNVEIAARLLVEMMCPESGVQGDDRAALQEDLLSLLRTTAPASQEPIIVDLEGENALLDVRAGFWSTESTVSTTVPYQITLQCPEVVDITQLQFSSLVISYSDERADDILTSSDNTGNEKTEIVTIGEETKASLSWTSGKVLVIDGQLNNEVDDTISISGIKLCLKQGSWDIEIHFIPQPLAQWTTSRGALATVHELASSLTFTSQPHAIDVDVTHHSSAFVGEDLPILVKVTNDDEREMDIHLNIYLQTSQDNDDSSIVLDDTSSSLHENISLGTVPPHTSKEKTIYLRSTQEGNKIIDLSIQSVTHLSSKSLEVAEDIPHRVEEITKTLDILACKPFDVQNSVRYTHTKQGGEALLSVLVCGPSKRDVFIQEVKLETDDGGNAKLLSSSLNHRSIQDVKWNKSTRYAIAAVFSVPADSGAGIPPPKVPGQLIFIWKSDPTGSTMTTTYPLPPLHLPPTDSYITPILHLPKPPLIQNHKPFKLSLSIRNTHPTTPAQTLTLMLETKEDFVWQGNRNIHLPLINPNGEIDVRLIVVYLGGEGWISLPKISVWEGEGEEREEINVLGSGGPVLVRA